MRLLDLGLIGFFYGSTTKTKVLAKNNTACFAVEGDKDEEEYPAVYVDKDCTCYCQTCNKYINLKAGDCIPPCCGKLMELLD